MGYMGLRLYKTKVLFSPYGRKLIMKPFPELTMTFPNPETESLNFMECFQILEEKEEVVYFLKITDVDRRKSHTSLKP